MAGEAYLRQAEQFLRAAALAAEHELWSPCASAAIHAAINANDAACLALAGDRPRTRDHARAARELVAACRGTRWEAEAPKRAEQLRDIIAQKDAAEYAGAWISADRARRLLQQAERFAAWARSVLSEQ